MIICHLQWTEAESYSRLPYLFYSEAVQERAQEYAAGLSPPSVSSTQPDAEPTNSVSPQSDQNRSTTQVYQLEVSKETSTEGPISVTKMYVLDND